MSEITEIKNKGGRKSKAQESIERELGNYQSELSKLLKDKDEIEMKINSYNAVIFALTRTLEHF